MKTFDEGDACAHWPKLVKQAAAGEEVAIARAGRTVARLVPAATAVAPAYDVREVIDDIRRLRKGVKPGPHSRELLREIREARLRAGRVVTGSGSDES